jgi:carboxypeptidase C (cathepsin A)
MIGLGGAAMLRADDAPGTAPAVSPGAAADSGRGGNGAQGGDGARGGGDARGGGGARGADASTGPDGSASENGRGNSPGRRGGAAGDTARPSTRAASSDDKLSVTEHQITLNGQTLSYEATAGTMAMKDEAGKPLASFFFVSYVKQAAENLQNRPITFVFNGGPGAAAVWLHLGCVGPQKIDLPDNGIPGAPPYRLVDNPQTWLDISDLVFIDPVGTGFSRPAEGRGPDDFYNTERDISTVGEFIRLYITRYQRWNSPKFLAGESYGTTRAAGLSEHLLDVEGINLNGIILISSILNFQTLEPSDGNDLPYALYLPSYTAIALYHHKLQTTNEDQLLADVSHYATGDYMTALAKGGKLAPADRAAVAGQLSKYTGLPADYIDKANLRIGPTAFRKQLLNDQKLILGRFDARITGEDPEPANSFSDYDPSLSLYLPIYTGLFNDYVRRELKFESDLRYEVLNERINFNLNQGRGGYLDVTPDLQQAMIENPHMKVLVNSSYEDLATPFLATGYTFDRLDLTDRLKSNVTMDYYHSGHMIYHDHTALLQLKANVKAFMADAAPNATTRP